MVHLKEPGAVEEPGVTVMRTERPIYSGQPVFLRDREGSESRSRSAGPRHPSASIKQSGFLPDQALRHRRVGDAKHIIASEEVCTWVPNQAADCAKAQAVSKADGLKGPCALLPKEQESTYRSRASVLTKLRDGKHPRSGAPIGRVARFTMLSE